MNLLLEQLPPQEANLFDSEFDSVELRRGSALFELGAQLDRVYFIDQGVVAMVSVFSDGSTAEITTVGREGFVNIGSLLDDDLAIARHTVQAPGRARVILADSLQRIVRQAPMARALLYRYAQALIGQISQSVACNCLHSTEARLARWLLMIHDRTDGDQLRLTHEFLAQMLGVRRPTVTLLALAFQAAGWIDYSRGRITILDRAGLENASCECYGIITSFFERLVGVRLTSGSPSEPAQVPAK